MRKVVCLTAGLAMVMVQVSACSTQKGFVNYSDYKKEMPIKAGAWDGQSLGSASASAGGAVWDDCKEKSDKAVRELIANAKGMGGNAIGNVKWGDPEKGGTSEATCRKGWGWVMLAPFLLTPLFMNTNVRGDVYKIKGSSKSASLFMLPNSIAEENALVEQLVAL